MKKSSTCLQKLLYFLNIAAKKNRQNSFFVRLRPNNEFFFNFYSKNIKSWLIFLFQLFEAHRLLGVMQTSPSRYSDIIYRGIRLFLFPLWIPRSSVLCAESICVSPFPCVCVQNSIHIPTGKSSCEFGLFIGFIDLSITSGSRVPGGCIRYGELEVLFCRCTWKIVINSCCRIPWELFTF